MTLPPKLRERNAAEAELNKEVKRLERRIKEKSSLVTLRKQVDSCSAAYDSLETSHYAWLDFLHADKPDPETAKQYLSTVDSWMLAIDKKYNDVIEKASAMLPSPDEDSEDTSLLDRTRVPSSPQAASPGNLTLDLSEAMAERIVAPNIDCMTFGENPRDWKLFEAEFEVNVKCHFKCEKKLVSYLLKFTSHKARLAVKPHVTSGSKQPFTDAWNELVSLFGTPAILARHILNDLKDGPSVVTADELLEFARDIQQAVNQLAHTPHESDIGGHAIIDDLLVRLSNSVHVRWSKTALKHKVANEVYPDINDFLKFIRLLAAESNDEYYGIDAAKRRATKSNIRYKDRKGAKKSENANSSFVSQEIQNAATVSSPQRQSGGRKTLPAKCLFCDKERHDLKSCGVFLGLEAAARWDQRLNKSKICWKCLCVSCSSHSKCKVNNPCDCAMPFHFLLHHKPCSAQTKVKPTNDVPCVRTSAGYTILPVIEVVCGGKLTYALQDSASTASYITADLAKSLNLSTIPSENFTRTINGTVDTNHHIIKSIKVRGKGQYTFQTLKNVFVCSQIPASPRTVALDPEEHPYLDGLDLQAQRNETVGLLIGSDSGLNRPLDCKEHPTSPKNYPYAVKYPLGWAISGPVNDTQILRPDTNDCAFIECRRRSAPERLDQIEADIRKMYDIERGDAGRVMSVEDKMVLEFWEREVKIDQYGHYELPIPFKDVGKKVPNNREYAMKRLRSLHKKLEKTGIHERYEIQLMSMVKDGFMEMVPEDCLGRDDGRVWYLPHFDVIRPDKPGKIRIVMDAKSEFEDVSLNKLCYQGPDMSNKLFNILLRFREYHAAWSADVTAMYLQVRIPVQQRDMLRVLWSQQGKVTEYRMTSHIFGGIWCAASSTFALRKAVEDARASAEVAEVVNRDFYVDDVLKSVSESLLSCRQPADVRDALAVGKFSLVKFQATHPDLLRDIAEHEHAPPIKTIKDEDHAKALGMHWNMSTDTFYYDVEVLRNINVTTKRLLLSATASLWDPLGCISPLLIPPKRLFQRAVRLGLGWDDQLPTDIINGWNEWFAGLHNIKDLQFPRAMLRENIGGARIEIHHFSDASEEAYGCAAYVRVEYPNGEIDVNLLCAKGRVAPIAHVTIPRLELTAAHLAAKMDVTLRQEMTAKVVESHFWSDSTVTLHYIRNTTLRLQTFVANRVSFIHLNTPVCRWHHVRTDVNIADIISRGVMSVDELPSTWINGPDFLSQPRNAWPPEVELNAPSEPLELKTAATVVSPAAHSSPDVDNDDQVTTNAEGDIHPLDVIIKKHSSAYFLFIIVAWWRRLCTKGEKQHGPIQVAEMLEAETFCVRHVQQQCYHKEIKELSRKDTGKKIIQVDINSPIRSLRPMLVDGILRVGGRLSHANPELTNTHPIILPRGHPLSLLIIRREHIKAHLGAEWTLSMLRQKYWVIGARHTLRKIRQKCVTCHRNFSMPKAQVMADLPPERCAKVTFAFTNTGVDLFGPFYVKVGRAQVKRWVTLFTCLSIRAIHLEVVYSMSADSFVMALQRFAARRGLPVSMRSDNGTNLVGAESELNTAWQEVNTDDIVIKARSKGIDWRFNPPKASEMGGVWERQIKTVRKCLTGILNPKVALDDETLLTALCEAENLVNSRPITRVSQDPEDGALTPNHLLMMKANVTDDHLNFNLGAIYRRNWKKVCMLKDQFWNKWSKEYLAEQQQRKVWDKQREDFKVNDIVLLADSNIPRSQWPLAIITKIFAGRDNLIREVELKTESSRLRRPVNKLVKLEAD